MIVPMKRLSLIALKEDEESIMCALQAINAVQLIKTGNADEVKDDDAVQKAEGRYNRFHGAMTLLRPYAKSPSMLDAKPEMTVSQLNQSVEGAQSISEKLSAADRKRTSLKSQIEKNTSMIEFLEPWSGLDVKLAEIASTKTTAVFAGRLKSEELIRLNELEEPCAYETYGGEKETAVLLLCPVSMQDYITAFIKDLNWAEVSFPKLDLSASEAISQYSEEIAELEKQQLAIEEEMKAAGESREIIANAEDAAIIERDRVFARTALEKTNSAFLLEGWVRSDEIIKVEKALADVTDAYYTEYRDPGQDEIPPAAIKNNSFAKPFEAVTNLYSRPLPGSIDATPLMAPWYAFLFGMMLSDTGYGILLALGCYFFIKRAKPKGMVGDLAKVMLWGGISTIFWGVLVGTFFGMDWNTLLGTPAGTFPLIVDPGTDPITMLILCFGLGLIHIMFGVFIKIYMCFRDGDWQSAVFDHISWVLIIAGLLLFALVPSVKTVGLVMAIVGAVTVLLMRGRDKKNIAGRFLSGAGGLYDITGYLSDVLSYARLFALGIATGVIGSVFNQLVSMIMGASTFIPVKIVLILVGAALLVFLHLFNLAINTLGTFVHCARLQYVEFYGKFYEVGGKEFKPLGYKTRHTTITDA